MENITEYIKPELLVLIPVLYFVGIAIKASSIKDKFIPLILGGIAIVLCAARVLASSPLENTADILTAVFTSVTQGVLVAGASVFTNQIIKQAGKEE